MSVCVVCTKDVLQYTFAVASSTPSLQLLVGLPLLLSANINSKTLFGRLIFSSLFTCPNRLHCFLYVFIYDTSSCDKVFPIRETCSKNDRTSSNDTII